MFLSTITFLLTRQHPRQKVDVKWNVMSSSKFEIISKISLELTWKSLLTNISVDLLTRLPTYLL